MNLTNTRTVQLLGSLGLVVLTLLLWLFLLSPRMSKPGELTTQAEDLQSANTQLQRAIDGLKQQQATLDQERARAAVLASRVPATADLPGLFTQIRQAAARAGIPENGLASITPSIPQAAAASDGSATLPGQGGATGVVSMQVSVAASAGLDQLLAFLRELGNMPRAYLVNSITLTQADDAVSGGSFSLNLGGSMFVLRAPTDPASAPTEVAVPEAGLVTAPAAEPDPVSDLDPFAEPTSGG